MKKPANFDHTYRNDAFFLDKPQKNFEKFASKNNLCSTEN